MKKRIFLCCFVFVLLLSFVSCTGKTANSSLPEDIQVVLYADNADTWTLDIQKDGTAVAAHGDRRTNRLAYLAYLDALTAKREEGQLTAKQLETVHDAVEELKALEEVTETQTRNYTWKAAVFVGDKTYNFIYDKAEKPEYCAVVEQIISCSPMEIVLDDFE